MGKAANNERIKLRATLYNNIAVALFVGGLFLPSLAIYQDAGAIGDWTAGWFTGQSNIKQFFLSGAFPTVVTLIAAFILFGFSLKAADEEIAKFKD